MKPTRLRPEEKAFLTEISQFGFANPFSEGREVRERELCNLPPNAPQEKVFITLLHRIATFVNTLQKTNRSNLQNYNREEREALEFLYLFDVFHRYMADFDKLIPRQIAAGDQSLACPFANRMMQELLAAGFTNEEAERGIGLCWQVRRAYFFITQKLTGESPCMRQLRERLWTNIFTCNSRTYLSALWNRMEDFSTLLLGETGSGKGSVAFAIGCSGFIPYEPATHKFRASFTRAFVALNLSQYPESLIESELFGHRKGAFTGASEAHEGVFAHCSPYGAIFLDEIGDVSPAVQLKLLRVLQERLFQPVGSHQTQRFAGRVIAATNKDIEQLRAEGHFRDDFYYRLCSDTITIPALRDRLREDPEELCRLCKHILERVCGVPDLKHTARVVEALQRDLPLDYRWPGNVRELEQAVRRILLTGRYHPPDTSAPPVPSANTPAWMLAAAKGELSAEALLAAYCQALYDQHGQYGEVARITGLNWRTAKKYTTRNHTAPLPRNELP